MDLKFGYKDEGAEELRLVLGRSAGMGIVAFDNRFKRVQVKGIEL